MSIKHLKTEILSCLRTLKGSGKFATIQRHDFILPGLHVEGVGEISFPLHEIHAKALLCVAEQAPFGKGSETIVDTQVRRTQQIDAAQFQFANPQWQRFLDQQLEQIKTDLGLKDYTITASPYKLLVYQTGDFFLSHKDAEKEKGMFGSLIINLPSHYTGGELSIQFDGEEIIADFAQDAANYTINCAAFYADCDHEIKLLTSGYRICLVYNLIQQKTAPKIELHSMSQYVDHLVDIFQRYPSDQPYITLLGHQYTPENFAYHALKLNDRYKADVLLKAAKKMGYYAKLCLVTAYQSGTPVDDGYNYSYGEEGGDENAEIDEIHDESLDIENWLDNEYPALSHIHFEENDLITSFAVDEGEPIVKESTGFMGNYGPDLTHWYHHAAVVIWSPEQNVQLLAQQDVATQLSWMAYFTQNQTASKLEIAAINQQLDYGFGDRCRQPDHFNAVVDWLIWQNHQAFLNKIEYEYLQLLFNRIDAEYWQKLLDWLPQNEHVQFFEKITTEIYPSFLEKLLAVFCVLLSDTKYAELIQIQMELLPMYWAKLPRSGSIQLSSSALTHLFALDAQLSPNQAWIDCISQAMITHLDWKYIHQTLVPQLLKNQSIGKIHAKLMDYCQQYLQQRVDQPPQPPKDWQRALPDTQNNVQVWQMLADFMQSATEEIFDYRKNQAERTLVENAIRNTTVDLAMETIRKGSPHTLRLMKTQASYERLLRNWEQDVWLLRKIKSKSTS